MDLKNSNENAINSNLSKIISQLVQEMDLQISIELLCPMELL